MHLTGVALILMAVHCSGLCPTSNAPVIENANYCVQQDVELGNNFTYTCAINYRVAPMTGQTMQTTITVTCLDNGEFSTPVGECVYMHPESCVEYFHRDDIYETFPDGGCDTVIIDPQGPCLRTDPTNPPAMSVQCCKESSTSSSVITRVKSTHFLQHAQCSWYYSFTTFLLPSTVSHNDVGPFCEDTLTPVTYSNYEHEIYTVLSQSTGTCTQTITMECGAEFNQIAPIFKFNHQFSGFMYGMGYMTHDLYPTTYLGGVCDCAISPYPYSTTCGGGKTVFWDLTVVKSQNVTSWKGSDCVPIGLVQDCKEIGTNWDASHSNDQGVGGLSIGICQYRYHIFISICCNCVRPEPGETFSRDTITRHLTPANPSYVRAFEYSIHSHDIHTIGRLLDNITMNIGDIDCTETYPYTPYFV